MTGERVSGEGAAQLTIRRQPNSFLVVEADLPAEKCQFPVFSWREDVYKDEIARRIARGEVGVVFGVGNYGLIKAVADPRRGRDYDSSDPFYTAKLGRPVSAKIPIYAPPKFWENSMDRRKIHPGFRPLFQRENLEKFYEEVTICHLIVPSYDRLPGLDPVFVTTLSDWVEAGKPKDAWTDQRTVSLFWWNDPDASDIADLVARYDPTMTVGISSFNDRGEKPAFNFVEVLDYVLKKKKVPFDFVVRDEVGEAVGVRSSHPQFRVPLVGEEPYWRVVRQGSVSIDRFVKATGLPFEARTETYTTWAPRDHLPEKNLDSVVDEVRDRVNSNWRARRRK